MTTRRAKRSRQKRAMTSRIKLERGCASCGLTDVAPALLHFDHLPEFVKVENVSDMCSQDYAWQRILDEIGKCQVLCVECHKEVTASRSRDEMRKRNEEANGPAYDSVQEESGHIGQRGTSAGEGILPPLLEPGHTFAGQIRAAIETVTAAFDELESVFETQRNHALQAITQLEEKFSEAESTF